MAAGVNDDVLLELHGFVDPAQAAELRHDLVHAIRHLRPQRVRVDLRDVSGVDPIALGALVAACYLGDVHDVAVLVDNPPPTLAEQLAEAGLEAGRVRRR